MAPKSNAVYAAWNAARSFVKQDGSRPVPERLRNAPTRLMKDLGFGRDYRYAHDEDGGFAAGERYLPDGMPDGGPDGGALWRARKSARVCTDDAKCEPWGGVR